MSELGFWAMAAAEPSRVAVVDDGGAATTFGELSDEQNAVSHGLASLGLTGGDVVAVVLPNRREFLAIALACAQSGLYFLPVNTHLGAAEIAYILGDSGARVVVTDRRHEEVTREAAAAAGVGEGLVLTVDGDGGPTLADLVQGQPTTRPETPVAGEIMVYTSGTTGRPKGVRRPLSGLAPEVAATAMGRFVMFFCSVGVGAPHAQLVTGPLYHTTPGGLAISGLHVGHTVVLMDKWEPARTLELIERHGITYLHVVPTMFHRMLSLPAQQREAHDLSSLCGVLHGAAPCPVGVKRRMIEWLGPIVNEYYGSSEGGGALVRSAEWLERPGTVGLPWPGSTIKVLGTDGQECAPGETGTVYLHMAGWDFEYHNAPDKTRASLLDGFFTVGDLGHLDADGYLFLSGRSSELIISGGTNIYPAEIEGCLLEHPAVADVGVIGVPNEEWGEEVKAVVELRPDAVASDELAADLVAHCRARLAGFKVPRSVDFTQALPRTDAGKLYKRLLIDAYAKA